MRYQIFAASAALLGAIGCVEKVTAPENVTPPVRLTATITEANVCTVNVLNTAYQSIGQIRGDVPSKFIGTVADKSYHGFGCWVATSGGDGDLIVLFSGNNLGKPLAVGTYTLSNEVLDDTPAMRAQVVFRPSALGGDKLRTLDNSAGSVVVEATPTGGRIIRVNADVVRWGAAFSVLDG